MCDSLDGAFGTDYRDLMQEAARKAAESADSVPEVEEDEQLPAAAPAASIHRLEAETNLAGGLQEMPRAAATAGGTTGPAPSERPPQESAQPSAAATTDASASSRQPAVAAPEAFGAAVGPTPGVPVGKAPGGLQSRQHIAAQRRRLPGAAPNGRGAASVGGGGGMSAADAQAAVAANLARLSNARKATAEEGTEEVRIVQVCGRLAMASCAALMLADPLRALTGPRRA